MSAQELLADIRALQTRYRNVSVQDKGRAFNTDLLEALELGFLLDIAEVVVVGALNREESRGGHFREDFPKRDDAQYMRHTMAYRRPPGAVAPSSPVGSEAAAVVAATSRSGAEMATSRPGAATPGTFDVALGYKPVVVTRYQPMERKY